MATRTTGFGIQGMLFFFMLLAGVSLAFLMLDIPANLLPANLESATLTDEQLLKLYPEPVFAMPYTKVSKHGIEKHPEAAAIEKACNKGIFQVWKDRYEKKYYYICQLEDGKWGIIPVIISGGTEIWKTAFCPGNGIWTDVVRYLSNTATKYNGVVR